jgi:DNA-binding CsgD family transcriptional regulator
LHGIYWLVSNIAAQRPVVLVIDDAHWSDTPSLRALAYLARRLDAVAVAVIVAARPPAAADDSELLDGLRSTPEGVRLSVQALSAEGSGELVNALAPTPVDAGGIRACHRATGGNPLLLAELVFALAQADAPVTAETVGELVRTGSDSLTHSVMLRLGGLGRHAVAVTTAIAILDLNSRLDLVAALAGLDVEAVGRQIDRLVAAHVLTDTVPLSFAHPLLRSAVYGELAAVQRSGWHGRAAQLLDDAGVPREQVATQLLSCEPLGDERTVDVLLAAAADAAAKAAPAIAARFLRRAIAEPPPASLRAQALLRLGLVEAQLGEHENGERDLRAALAELREPADRMAGSHALAEVLAATEGHAAAVAVLEDAAAGLDGDLALMLDIQRTMLSLYVPELAGAACVRMGEYEQLPGKTPTERLALASAALAKTFDPTACAADALALAHRALGDGALLAEHTADAIPYACAKWVLLQCEDVDGADRESERGLEDSRARGSALGFATTWLSYAMSAMTRGELQDTLGYTEALFVSAADIPRTPTTMRGLDAGGACLAAEALIGIGDLDRARATVAEVCELGDIETAGLFHALYARGSVALAAGHYPAALADFLAYGAVTARLGYEERPFVWRQHAALAHAALGDHDAAIALADQALANARVWGAPRLLGLSLRVRAVVGDLDDQRCERLEQAVSVLNGSVSRLELARALIDHGVELRRIGKRHDARSQLQRGMELAARCHALQLADRARAELRVLGARPRRLMFSGVESLTASERRIALLAAEGHTNREIAQDLYLAQKTIENHLASVYRKLDIRSRQDLPEVLTAKISPHAQVHANRSSEGHLIRVPQG